MPSLLSYGATKSPPSSMCASSLLAFLLGEGFGIAYEHHPNLTTTAEILDTYRQDEHWSAYEEHFDPLSICMDVSGF
jgi:hypothetical protein